MLAAPCPSTLVTISSQYLLVHFNVEFRVSRKAAGDGIKVNAQRPLAHTSAQPTAAKKLLNYILSPDTLR